jgi:hypothetical protein
VHARYHPCSSNRGCRPPRVRGACDEGPMQVREELLEGETKALDVVIANVRVRGRVTAGGKGVAGHQVSFHGGPLLGARTDDDGWYELLVPVAGRYFVSAFGPALRAFPPQRIEVDVPDVDVHRLDLYVQ